MHEHFAAISQTVFLQMGTEYIRQMHSEYTPSCPCIPDRRIRNHELTHFIYRSSNGKRRMFAWEVTWFSSKGFCWHRFAHYASGEVSGRVIFWREDESLQSSRMMFGHILFGRVFAHHLGGEVFGYVMFADFWRHVGCVSHFVCLSGWGRVLGSLFGGKGIRVKFAVT